MEMKVAEVALATALAIIVFPGNWSVVVVVVVVVVEEVVVVGWGK